MKEIVINHINQYSSFITRNGKKAVFVKHVPSNNEKNRLVFVVGEQILGCDEKGICWYINGNDSSITESRYMAYDVFVDDKCVGWLNLETNTNIKEKNILSECSSVIYASLQEALKHSTEKTYKTIKLEWTE